MEYVFFWRKQCGNHVQRQEVMNIMSFIKYYFALLIAFSLLFIEETFRRRLYRETWIR